MQRNTGASKPALLRFRLQPHFEIGDSVMTASDGKEPVGGIDRTGAIDPIPTSGAAASGR